MRGACVRWAYLRGRKAGDFHSTDNTGKNCVVVHERNAEGSCIRTSFGDWKCSMAEYVNPDAGVSNQPPPR